jgi:hypothetical protein
MKILFYSKQERKFQFTHKCHNCRKFSFVPHYFKGDGTKISSGEVSKIANLWVLKSVGRLFSKPKDKSNVSDLSGVVAQCPKCEEKWPVFSSGKLPESLKQPHQEIKETHRSEEEIGAEKREIDNAKSSIELERRFTVTKEWSKSFIVEEEKGRKKGAELAVGLGEAASIKATVEQAIRVKYISNEGIKEIYTEEIVLKVPAYTKLLVVLNWKRIWQHGIITLHDENGGISEWPFKLVVGVTFDQTQVDQP